MTDTDVTPSSAETVFLLTLDFASLELSAGECEELVRGLRARGGRPDGAAAAAAADRLDLMLGRRAEPARTSATEIELDAIADVAWEWVERAGTERVPERVLLALDVLRSRHAHE